MPNTTIPSGCNSAKIRKVIETKAVRGLGTGANPYRTVTQYWSMNGLFLAEYDPMPIVSKPMSLADRRRALQLSQAEVARALNVDQSAVHLWEVGKTKPQAAKLPLLADLLQCSIEELLQPTTVVTD